jgi:putative heme-binding domain-containing protein
MRTRWFVSLGLLVLIGVTFLLPWGGLGRDQVARAAEGEGRTPWTTGKVVGTPEPPPAFRAERLYPKIRFREPTEVDLMPGSDRWFVAEKGGKVFSFPKSGAAERADLVVDVTQLKAKWKQTVPHFRGFDSLYGMTFHPDFKENHFIYLCYALDVGPRTEEPVGTIVSRFTVSAEEPPRIDVASEKFILQWQAGGHNAGCLKFGPDGCLYVSTGDQADPNPPDVYNTGQDISDLRSSILRIDVDHAEGDHGYAIPKDNPFVNLPKARGEVWCYGLRNPWRMSFDRATGNLWVGDVGWELWEMVHCAKSGGNYGWSAMEGPNPVRTDLPRGPTPITPPLLALSHSESASITGGIVYRGKRFPQLVGHYVFGDWMTRRVWAAQLTGPDKVAPHRTIAETEMRVVAFAQDADGELYILDHEGGGIYTLAENAEAGQPSRFPRTLGETGIFADVAAQSPAVGVVRFSPKVAQWVDGASTEWFLSVPGRGTVRWKTDDVYGRLQLGFPKNSVLARTFSLPVSGGAAPGSRQKIETQLLHFDGGEWRGYSYRWREDGSDADLVDEAGGERPLVVDDASVPGGKRRQTWHFYGRAQCMTCHTPWSGYTLAFTEEQLDGPGHFPGADSHGNQGTDVHALGLFPGPYKNGPGKPSKTAFSLVDPYDASADVGERARSYLHVNCSVCHRMGGGGSALIDLRKEMMPKQTHAIDERPMLGAFGIDDPRIVYPGDPGRSVLLYRMCKTGSGRMPKIGSEVVDERGVSVIGEWIASMSSEAGGDAAARRTQRDATIRSVAANGDGVERLVGSTSAALALAYHLHAGDVAASDGVRGRLVGGGLASASADVRDLFESFTGGSGNQRPRLGARFDRAKLLAMSGDASRGREVFEKLAQCAACHVAGGVAGKDLGPDLTHIASKYDRAQLLEQVVEPSKQIAEGFTGYTAQTADGDVVSGLRVKQDDREVVLKDATGQLVHIPIAEAKTVRPLTTSIMPEGLMDNLEPQQAADLMAFLASQK